MLKSLADPAGNSHFRQARCPKCVTLNARSREALAPFPSIQASMKNKPSLPKILRRTAAAVFFVLFATIILEAQDQDSGPLTPPPEHNVKRITGVELPEAPPSLPAAQIIKAFTQKEEAFFEARPQFSYRKTIRIQEFGPDGKPSGEYTAIYDAVRSGDGKIYEKGISAPESTLQYLQFEPEDVQMLSRIPAFPVLPAQLAKYDLQYLGTETVDEVECYIFQAKPRLLDRQHSLFDGVLWVDQKYLEVVKTYGRWVTDLGDMHPATLPFSMFETYRENVDGKYWFPDYARAEEVYKMKDHNVPIRVTIKWTNFKPFPTTAVPASPPPTPTPPASAPPTTKP